MHTVAAAQPAHTAQTDSLITEYLQHLKDLDRSTNTIDHYADVLARMDRQLPAGLASANADEFRDWNDAGGRQKVTRRHYRAIANGFFTWAVREEILDFNPVFQVPNVKVRRRHPRPVTTEEVFAILARAAAPYRLWYLIAAYAGLRCTELAGLQRQHITQRDMWICGKGDVERIVPTHPLIWAEVSGLSGHIIRRLDGKPANRRYVSGRGNHQLHEVLGLPGVTMHRLRRWFGTAAYAAADKDIVAVQELLGHASVNTTQIYIDTPRASMDHAVSMLPIAS
jgi:integrase/recombinase XerC